MSLTPLERRTTALVGEGASGEVAIPVAVTGDAKPGTITLQLPGGDPADAQLVPVDLFVPVTASPGALWTGLIGTWRQGGDLPDHAALRRDWILMISIDALADAATLTLPGGATVTLDRLDPQPRGEELLARAAARMVQAGADSPVDAAAFTNLLRPAIDWPSERWRAFALLRAIDPAFVIPDEADQTGGAGMVRVPGATPVALRTLSAQVQRRAAAAFARLAEADEPLAQRVADALLLTAHFDGGVLAPLWPEAPGQDAMLSELLNLESSPESRTRAASAWLAAQPPALTWVTDDAGRPLQTEDPKREQGARARLALINLGAEPVVAWAREASPRGEPQDRSDDEPTLLPARTYAELDVDIRVPRADPRAALAGAPGAISAMIALRVGNVQTGVPVRIAALPVAPPGATLGPLVQDWTMSTLRAGIAASPAVWTTGPEQPRSDVWLTAARLTRERSQWTLILQCNHPSSTTSEGEVVEVWLGPSAAPSAVISVRADGATKLMQGEAPLPAQLPIRHTAAPGGEVASWWVSVPIPGSAIDEDGTLRLGLIRHDARAVRSAWPRAMLPWQQEPGRAALDTRVWDLGEP